MSLGRRGTSPCLMPAEDVQDLCLCGWEADWHQPHMRKISEAFANLERLEDMLARWHQRVGTLEDLGIIKRGEP